MQDALSFPNENAHFELIILAFPFLRSAVTGEEEIEDYWFYCNQWFARSEGDHKIVRELLPTSEDGEKLTDLEGKALVIEKYPCSCDKREND